MMDKSKQPGISFDGIMLVKERFDRGFDVPNDSKMSINFEEANNIEGNKASVEITLTVKLDKEEKNVLLLESTFVGFFSVVNESENMDIEYYIDNNSKGLMFPYIREHITSVTSKAGIAPIMLPPINLKAMMDNKEK